jgi:flagellar biosynthesis protein FlhA
MDGVFDRGLLSGRFRVGAEVPLAIALIGILFVILVPLPTLLLDVLLIVNLTLSLIVLLIAASATRPMELSVFPSLLLVVTFFRLALNIATTRLILGNAGEGASAAGTVIYAFANFVAGSHLAVGFVVFAIILVVQFVVITKGSTRISEVAARFTLDAMPGKQLSIDSDLAAGFIDDVTARKMRREVSDEADFYGAMDGASKFVRGEAMAGFVITAVNIVGGLAIGVVYHGMSLERAGSVFTSLTIGDGLVTQIPALMVSVAAALLVTNNASGNGLAGDLGSQLFRNPRVFFVAGGFLLVLFAMPTGLPKPALFVAAVVCVGSGIKLYRRGLDAEEDAAIVEGETNVASQVNPTEEGAADGGSERARALLEVAPLELELGYRLVRLVDEARGGDLMPRLVKVREKVAVELGLVIPPLRVRDNVRLRATEYAVRLRGNLMGRWRVWPDRFFVTGGGEPLEGVQGVEARDPVSGELGLWADDSQWALVASAGYNVRRSEELMLAHLESLIRTHAAEILTRDEVARLLSDLSSRAPALVRELVPDSMRLGEVHRVLQNLLRERVSIRDLETIVEALADEARESRDRGVLTEAARRVLRRTICNSVAERNNNVHVALLDPALEEFLTSSIAGREGGRTELVLEPEVEETLSESVGESLARLTAQGQSPVLVCPGLMRRHVYTLVAGRTPDAVVLAYEEIGGEFHLVTSDSVALENVG